MRTIGLVSCLILNSIIYSQVNIIPQPAEMKIGKGSFTLKQPIGFIYNAPVPGDHGVKFFKDYVKKFYNVTDFKEGSEHGYGFPSEIFIDYDENYFSKGTYELTVDKTGITIRGGELGIFYAFSNINSNVATSCFKQSHSTSIYTNKGFSPLRLPRYAPGLWPEFYVNRFY
jgi:hypothetical protein